MTAADSPLYFISRDVSSKRHLSVRSSWSSGRLLNPDLRPLLRGGVASPLGSESLTALLMSKRRVGWGLGRFV